MTMLSMVIGNVDVEDHDYDDDGDADDSTSILLLPQTVKNIFV